MQRIFLVMNICVFFSIAEICAAQYVKITDYDVPVSRAQRLDLTGSFSLFEYQQYDDRSSYYSVDGTWQRYYNSLPFAWSAVLSGSWWGAKHNNSALVFNHWLNFDGAIDRYITNNSMIFGSADARIDWADDYLRPDIDIGIAAGVGRYVIATDLAKSVRIDEFLVKENILPHHLHKQALLDLASVIGRSREYRTRYPDSYLVHWYADMERIIVEDAVLPDGTIGPVGLMRMSEVLERERIRIRAYGWKIECGINIPVADRYASDPGDPVPYMRASAGYPLGLKHQLDAEVTAQTGVGGDFGRPYEISTTTDYVFELTNLIDILISDTYLISRRRWPASGGTNEETARYNSISTELAFYVENRVTINWRNRLVHRHFKWRNPGGDVLIRNDRLWQVEVSIGYHVF